VEAELGGDLVRSLPQHPHTKAAPSEKQTHPEGPSEKQMPSVMGVGRDRPCVGLGCGNGVGFVVKCIGIHIESSDSTTNPVVPLLNASQ
jgi:hypothetical protein